MHKSKSLFTSVAQAAALAICGAAAMLTLTIQRHSAEVQEAAQLRVAVQASQALQLAASTLLEREWESLSAVAQRMDMDDYEELRDFLGGVEDASDAISWAGVASLDGSVLAGSGGAREQEDVSKEDWFVRGMQQPRVSGVFIPDANGSENGRSGFINMSRPSLNEFGQPKGVAVYSLQIAWLENFLISAAERLQLDFEVRDVSGGLIMRHGGVVDAPFNERVGMLANGSYSVSTLEIPEDGEPYTTALMPLFVDGGMPELNWSLIVRVPAHTTPTDILSVISDIRMVLLGMVGVIATCAGFFALAFLLPIHRLARQARSIGNGEEVYPIQSHSSTEAVDLSNAFAAMQTRIDSAKQAKRDENMQNVRELPKLVSGAKG